MSTTQRLIWTMALGVCAFSQTGCREEAAPDSPGVDVVIDARQIAAAREAWHARREKVLADALAHPTQNRGYDDVLELMRSQPERSKRALAALRDDPTRPAEERLEAVLVLGSLGLDPEPSELVALAGLSEEATSRLLSALTYRFQNTDSLPSALEDFVVQQFDHDSRHVRQQALRLVTSRGMESATPAVRKIMAATREPDNNLLRAAARLQPTSELLGTLEARLQPMGLSRANTGLDAITMLGRHAQDPALSRNAAEICVTYLIAQEDVRWIDGATLGAVAFVGEIQPPADARRLLTELIAKARWNVVRETALNELADLDPDTARELSQQYNLSLAEDDARQQTPSLTLPEWAEKCVQAGLLSRAEADAALAVAPREGDGRFSSDDSVEALLYRARRMISFDVETGMIPNRHDELILEFAEASAGRFRPEAVREDFDLRGEDYDGATYLVEFIHDGRLYRFRPQNLGDWYDLPAVITAIHRALADSGIHERFNMSTGDGQFVDFVFADPVVLQAAAPALGLAIFEDHGRPHAAGKAFEEEVVRELER